MKHSMNPVLLAVALTLLIAGCGSAPASVPATVVVTVTTTQTTTTTLPPPTTNQATVEDSSTTTTTVATKSTAPAASSPSEAAAPVTSSHPATIKVPNGVGMNYQAAQDLWRGKGLVVMPATDGLGAHRVPVIDSNWLVLAQDLEPGSVVKWGTAITATVIKYTDR